MPDDLLVRMFCLKHLAVSEKSITFAALKYINYVV